jgi:hypothetical protein
MNLALKDLWTDPSFSAWLREIDSLFKGMAAALEMGTAMQDSLNFYACMISTAFQPGAKHECALARCRWNSRSPLATNLAANYPAFLLQCIEQSKSPKWLAWKTELMQFRRYLQIHMFADILNIFQTGWELEQGQSVMAADIPERILDTKAALSGYILGALTPAQRTGEGPFDGELSQDWSICRRALIQSELGSGKWLVQKGLKRLGWKTGMNTARLQIRLVVGSAELVLPLTTSAAGPVSDARSAFMWAKNFVLALIDRLDHRFGESAVWRILRTIFDFPTFESEHLREEDLRHLAEHFDYNHVQLIEEWKMLRLKVLARCSSDDVKKVFDQKLMLCIAEFPESERGLLHHLGVTKAITIGNTAKLERDLKGLREIWRYRGRKIDCEKLAMQMRLHSNHKDRKETEKEMDHRVNVAFAEFTKGGSDRREFGGRKRRSDFGGKHEPANIPLSCDRFFDRVATWL